MMESIVLTPYKEGRTKRWIRRHFASHESRVSQIRSRSESRVFVMLLCFVFAMAAVEAFMPTYSGWTKIICPILAGISEISAILILFASVWERESWRASYEAACREMARGSQDAVPEE